MLCDCIYSSQVSSHIKIYLGSTYQASYAQGFSKSIMSSMISSRASLDSVTDEISEPISPKPNSGLQEKIDAQSDSEKVSCLVRIRRGQGQGYLLSMNPPTPIMLSLIVIIAQQY